MSKIQLSKKQVDYFFMLGERVLERARVAGDEDSQRDLMVMGEIAEQWLRKYGQLRDEMEKAVRSLENKAGA